MHEEETSYLGDGGDNSMRGEIDFENCCLAGFSRVYFCGVPVNAAQTEIANDT